jgi:hypothetical protein
VRKSLSQEGMCRRLVRFSKNQDNVERVMEYFAKVVELFSCKEINSNGNQCTFGGCYPIATINVVEHLLFPLSIH